MGLAGCAFDNPEAQGGHLFVENPMPSSEVVELKVVKDPTGETEEIVDAKYRIPSSTVLQFDNVLTAGSRYSIQVNIPNNDSTDSVQVRVRTCDEQAPSERMDVRVRAARDSLGIIPLGCDESYTYREQDYVDPSKYRVSN